MVSLGGSHAFVPGDDRMRGRRQLQRGAQAVTHRHSVHRRVNVVRGGANCEEQPICRLLFTVGLAIIEP